MSISSKLKSYLDENHVKYVVITHSRAYTAQEIAAAVHIPGIELAKSVIVKCNGSFAMVVLPASYKINFDMLRSALKKEKVSLASEDEFKSLFPECEIGAEPPFGNLYKVPVYMAQSLSNDKEIVFNAGTHTEVIRMSLDDYKRLVKPEIIKISEHV